jgi:hypothetical protein
LGSALQSRRDLYFGRVEVQRIARNTAEERDQIRSQACRHEEYRRDRPSLDLIGANQVASSMNVRPIEREKALTGKIDEVVWTGYVSEQLVPRHNGQTDDRRIESVEHGLVAEIDPRYRSLAARREHSDPTAPINSNPRHVQV